MKMWLFPPIKLLQHPQKELDAFHMLFVCVYQTDYTQSTTLFGNTARIHLYSAVSVRVTASWDSGKNASFPVVSTAPTGSSSSDCLHHGQQEEDPSDGEVRLGQDLHAFYHLCQLHSSRHSTLGRHHRRRALARAASGQPHAQLVGLRWPGEN